MITASEKQAIDAWFSKGRTLIRGGSQLWHSGLINACHEYSNHSTAHTSAYIVVSYMLGDTAEAVGAIDGASMPVNWKTLVKESIYMPGDPVLGCDRVNPLAKPPVAGEVFDRYRHYDDPSPSA